VRDRDQLGARTYRALGRGEVELPGRVVADHVDRDPDAPHLQEREIIRQVLGLRDDDAVARPERYHVERHVPAAGQACDERDLVPVRADQGGAGVVDVRNAPLCFGCGLVAADGGLARQQATG
jgi:hypothetical protein